MQTKNTTIGEWWAYQPAEKCAQRRYFWGFGWKKNRHSAVLRPGAMSPEEVKEAIRKIGNGKVVEIFRIGFDGKLDDFSIIMGVTNIDEEGFEGKIVNAERCLIEKNTSQKVWAKWGGGNIRFNFYDGDIKEINLVNEVNEIKESRDVNDIIAVLKALEANDRILVAYFDEAEHGAVNVEGQLAQPLNDNNDFGVVITKVNGVELDQKINKKFNVKNDLVIDVSII
jgi:hypothetical protein